MVEKLSMLSMSGQERSVRRGGDVGDFLQQLDIFRPAAELVIPQQGAEGRAAEDAVFLFVDLLEEGALIELGRPLQVAQQFLLGDVEHADLELVAGFALIHEVLETAPTGFQFLEILVVQHFVELKRNQVIDLRDARGDHGFGVLGYRHGAFQNLRHELLHQILAAFSRRGVARQAAFIHDLVEQPAFDGLFGGGRLGRALGVATHWNPPSRPSRSAIWPACPCR
jgi:hypothetical protein